MPSTKIGIVYATNSGILRRWIIPDNDVDLNSKHPVADGETMMIVELSTIKSQKDIETAVTNAIGKPVPSARCVIVDKLGNVIGSIMADPELDTVSAGALMLHDSADIGWTLTDGILIDPISVDLII